MSRLKRVSLMLILATFFFISLHASVSLAANPTSVPANGSQSALSARAYEPNSGVNLPCQMVSFSMLFGILNPPSPQTDSSGIAHAWLASPGVEGADIELAILRRIL